MASFSIIQTTQRAGTRVLESPLSGPAGTGFRALRATRRAATRRSPKKARTAMQPKADGLRGAGRLLLGCILMFTGVSHLTWAREDFQAQVPDWVPVDQDFVVVASGGVEIALGAALTFLRRERGVIGKVAAAFFVAVFPGNIAQWRGHRDAFGLDTDGKRLARLFFQPLLVVWALWSTSESPTRR